MGKFLNGSITKYTSILLAVFLLAGFLFTPFATLYAAEAEDFVYEWWPATDYPTTTQTQSIYPSIDTIYDNDSFIESILDIEGAGNVNGHQAFFEYPTSSLMLGSPETIGANTITFGAGSLTGGTLIQPKTTSPDGEEYNGIAMTGDEIEDYGVYGNIYSINFDEGTPFKSDTDLTTWSVGQDISGLFLLIGTDEYFHERSFLGGAHNSALAVFNDELIQVIEDQYGQEIENDDFDTIQFEALDIEAMLSDQNSGDLNGAVVPMGQFLRNALEADRSQILNNRMFEISDMTIGDLQPGETYYAQIVAQEIGDPGAAYSNLVGPFTTKTSQTDLDKNYEGSPTAEVSGGSPQIDYLQRVTCYNVNLPDTWEVNIQDCLIYLAEYGFKQPTTWLLGLAGRLLDGTAAFSLSSTTYRDSDFVDRGWTIVRDIANILFIFALLYAAISLILNTNSYQAKRIIANVIIIGLLINFSLFLSNVIIDAGNIFARIFYDNIEVQGVQEANTVDTEALNIEEKSISRGLMAGLDINKLVSPDVFQKAVDQGEGQAKSALLATLLLVGIVHLITAYAFFVIAYLAVFRVATLWLYAILSPFAFASSLFPFLSKSKIGFSQWFGTIAKSAFLIGIFLFFYYLILLLVQGQFLDSIFLHSLDMPFFQFILSIILQFSIIMALLLVAVKASKGMASELSNKLTKVSEKVGKTAFGVAAGGTALVGGAALGAAAWGARNTVGKQAAKTASSQRLQEKAKQRGISGGLARLQLGASEKLARSSFDARKTKVAGLAGSKRQKQANMLGSPRSGGYIGGQERKINKRKDWQKRVYSVNKTDDEVKEESQKLQQEYDEAYQNERQRAFEYARKDDPSLPENFEDWPDKVKEEFERKLNASFELRNGPRPEVYDTADEASQANLRARAENLKQGNTTFLGNVVDSASRQSIDKRIRNSDAFEKEYQEFHENKVSELKETEGAQEFVSEKRQEYIAQNNGQKPTNAQEEQWKDEYARSNAPKMQETYKEFIREKKKEYEEHGKGVISGAATAATKADRARQYVTGSGKTKRDVGAALGKEAKGMSKKTKHKKVNEELLKRINRQLKDIRELEKEALQNTGRPATEKSQPEITAAINEYRSKINQDVNQLDQKIDGLRQQRNMETNPARKKRIDEQITNETMKKHRMRSKLQSLDGTVQKKNDLEEKKLNIESNINKPDESSSGKKKEDDTNTKNNKSDNESS